VEIKDKMPDQIISMPITSFRLLGLTLKKYWLEALCLAALATLPTEILSEAMGWGTMDPQGYLIEAAWLPVAMLCQLAMLRRIGKLLNVNAGEPKLRGTTLASALGAEFLFSLRFCVVLLLYCLPALIFISIFGLESIWSRLIATLLALAGSIPCSLYMLRRLFSPTVVLWQGLKASESLRESARLSQGKLGLILWPLLLWNGIALIFEGLSGYFLALTLVVLPLSFLFSTVVLAWAYYILTL
jgi:hypothetical protein